MCLCFFLFKQMTAYEMRISDWSSDVCSSDLGTLLAQAGADGDALRGIAAMLSRRLGQDAAIAFLARCASSFTAPTAPRLAPKAHDLRTEPGRPPGGPAEWQGAATPGRRISQGPTAAVGRRGPGGGEKNHD